MDRFKITNIFTFQVTTQKISSLFLGLVCQRLPGIQWPRLPCHGQSYRFSTVLGHYPSITEAYRQVTNSNYSSCSDVEKLIIRYIPTIGSLKCFKASN